MTTERLHIPLLPNKRPSKRALAGILAFTLAAGSAGLYAVTRESADSTVNDRAPGAGAGVPEAEVPVAPPATTSPGGNEFPFEPSTTQAIPTPTGSGDFSKQPSGRANIVDCDGFDIEVVGNGSYRFTPRPVTSGGAPKTDGIYTVGEVPTQLDNPRDAVRGIGGIVLPIGPGDMGAINIVDFGAYPEALRPDPDNIESPLAATYPLAKVIGCGIATYRQVSEFL